MFFTVKLNYIDHPLVRVEQKRYARLLTTTRLGRWLNLIGYTGLLLIATVPLFMYMGSQHPFRLFVLAVIILGYYALVILRTAAVIVEATVGAAQQQLELLMLTGMSAQQIVMGKWWALMRVLYPLWLIATIPKLGLAYGFAQYLHQVSVPTACWGVLPRGLCYVGSYSDWAISPEPVPVLLAFGTLLLIHGVVLALVGAVSLWSALRFGTSRIMAWIANISIIALLIGGGLLGSFFLEHPLPLTRNELNCTDPSSVCRLIFRLDEVCPSLYNPVSPYSPPTEACMNARRSEAHFTDLIWTYQKVVALFQPGILAFSEGGLSLAANLMRPEGAANLWSQFNNLMILLFTLVGLQTGTWLMLRLAVRAAIRRGMSP